MALLFEQDHRFIKRLTRSILGFKMCNSARRTLSLIEPVHMIRKGQLFWTLCFR
ncbi:hypothetical protein DID80_02230 [Candidatus Marinamargulisbacteria bacterium SCGC AAA071-K20]|nr:hypothetical protein DID80_02230 [Candidatus Marinamargulisbacteria bacterium SCGC AAA071-K20]